MTALTLPTNNFRRGIEMGFFEGKPLVYGGTEPCAIDAQAGKGKFTRWLGANLVSPRTAHLSKIITDPKDGELAWATWKTLERQGYRVLMLNPDGLYGYRSECYNINTRVIEVAMQPALHRLLQQTAYDAASFLVPLDPDPRHRWIGQGARTMFATYNALTARFPDNRFPCSPGGLWDFFGRGPDDVGHDLMLWASQESKAEFAGMCQQIASWTQSPNQWNAYASVIVERLQAFQPGSAARAMTARNSFDPARMKADRTALYVVGSARSESSRNLVGAMAAAVIERFADAHGPMRALVVGEEWGQLYVSNFFEMLTLYREAGVNFLGVFQNAPAQIEARYGRELVRVWKKAAAHTLYRGLPDSDTLKEIEYLSGRSSVMVRGFNVSTSQVQGSGDNLSEQARPLLQVEDIRRATGGEQALLQARDLGYFIVDVPNFWERPELSGYLRDVRTRPDRYAHLRSQPLPPPSAHTQSDSGIEEVLASLRARLN